VITTLQIIFCLKNFCILLFYQNDLTCVHVLLILNNIY
jgi:hypothetical protein